MMDHRYDALAQAIGDLAAEGIRSGGVAVHHSAGCPLDGSTEPHIHTQDEWRALIDGQDVWR